GRSTGERSAALLIRARVVAADRHGDEIAAGERRVHRRKAERAASREELLHLEREAGHPGRLVAVVGARAADRKIILLYLEQGAERIDVIGSAGESPGRIDAGARGTDPGQSEEVACVSIGIAEHDHPADL